jgi:hypothetical protein
VSIQNQLEIVLSDVVTPRVRTRTGAISKTDLLGFFIASENPELLTLSDIVSLYCERNSCESTNDLARSIAKSLRDIDIWVDEACKEGLTGIEIRFHVNQTDRPLIEKANAEQATISDIRFVEALPAAIEKVFQPKFPEPASHDTIVPKFQWLTSIFPMHLLSNAPDATLSTVARTVSLISLVRIRDIISQAIGYGSDVIVIRNPTAQKTAARMRQEQYILTILSEAYHTALFNATPGQIKPGSVKHVIIMPNALRDSYNQSPEMDDLRALRSRGQIVYLMHCDSDDEFINFDLSIAIESSFFVQFPAKGSPEALLVNKGLNSIDPHNRNLVHLIQERIRTGTMTVVHTSERLALPNVNIS